MQMTSQRKHSQGWSTGSDLFLNLSSMDASVGTMPPCTCLYITWKSISCLTNILIASKQKIHTFRGKKVMFSIAFVFLTFFIISGAKGLIYVLF